MTVTPGQPESLKRQNRQLLLSIIENDPDLSRATLARLSSLSRTTTSNLVKEFIEAGLVTERGDLSSTGGRPGTRLELTRDRWFALGAEFRGREWIFVLLDLQANVVQSLELPADSLNVNAVLRVLCDGLQQMRAGCPGKLLPAIGVGVPGLVDRRTGVIKQAEDLGWRDVPIAEKVATAMQLPAYVINRHRAAGLAEVRYGAGVGARELFYIGIGTGVSSALFIQGELVEGANSSSGEFGHMTVDPNGPPCSCGNEGCLQLFASGNAMVREAKRLWSDQSDSWLDRLTGEQLCEMARSGDSAALTCVERAGRYLGIAIANQINLLNPDTVVLGGPIGQSGDPLLRFVQAEVKRRALSYPLSACRIQSSSLGRNAGAIGAARLVLDRKLELIFAREKQE
jgi:glucokinase-like ROK family protein